jgi:phage tail-like protein
MAAPSLLPPIPQPPHDPTSWLLNGRVGWRAAKWDPNQIEQLVLDQSLVLALAPESKRSLTEASGSFGGLTLPGNVALGPDGSIYLLDPDKAQLKRFDPCECKFLPVPCFGGVGSGPRQLHDPHGIGICSGNLFVCDTGNHRLSVFALRGFVLRGHWQPPAVAYQPPDAQLTNPWEPYGLAFDQRGGVYVTDGVNGCIHRFSPSGGWEKCFAGFGSATWITIDCCDQIYVVAGTPPSVCVVNANGDKTVVTLSAEELSPHFPCAPFAVDAARLLHLGPLCADTGAEDCKESQPAPKCPPNQVPERGVFDLHGNPVKCVTPATLSYVTEGVYLSTALDSELYRCQWHRVILRGDLPAGARVVVSTYSAEAVLTDDQVQDLDSEWETNQTASYMQKGEWDCLVRSGGGRYLWLKLELHGNGRVTPRIDSVEIEFPRISLRRYLPAVFGEEPVSADFTDRFLGLFDTTLRSIETKLDQEARYFDPLSTPAERDPKTGVDFLSWLASWIGLTLDRQWPEAKRRKFLKQAGRLYDLRGTREGLWRELILFLEMETNDCCRSDQPRDRCQPAPTNCAPVAPPDCAWQPPPLILEHFKLRRWLFLGAGKLGDQAVLWGKRIVNRSQLDDGAQVGRTQLLTTQDPLRDPFHVYAHKFTVFVPASYRNSDAHRKALENLLRNARPASTEVHIEYVEPRFRIGFQSMIGFDSVVARYPAGVTLGETPLGRASVLTTPPYKEGGPSLEIGKQSRIGTTTKLE